MSVCPLRGADAILGHSVLESRAIPRLEPSITVEDAIRPDCVPQTGHPTGPPAGNAGGTHCIVPARAGRLGCAKCFRHTVATSAGAARGGSLVGPVASCHSGVGTIPTNIAIGAESRAPIRKGAGPTGVVFHQRMVARLQDVKLACRAVICSENMLPSPGNLRGMKPSGDPCVWQPLPRSRDHPPRDDSGYPNVRRISA